MYCSVFPDLGSMASDIKKALEASQNELKGFEKQNTYLEKECIIYKSQLEVTVFPYPSLLPSISLCLSVSVSLSLFRFLFSYQDLQNKLEKERKERRTSDSKSLKLLSEVREQSKVVQGLRDSQSKLVIFYLQYFVQRREEECPVISHPQLEFSLEPKSDYTTQIKYLN